MPGRGLSVLSHLTATDRAFAVFIVCLANGEASPPFNNLLTKHTQRVELRAAPLEHGSDTQTASSGALHAHWLGSLTELGGWLCFVLQKLRRKSSGLRYWKITELIPELVEGLWFHRADY